MQYCLKYLYIEYFLAVKDLGSLKFLACHIRIESSLMNLNSKSKPSQSKKCYDCRSFIFHLILLQIHLILDLLLL